MYGNLISTKICSHCGIEKSLDEFSKDKNTKDCKSSWCKLCKSINDEQFRYKNKARLTEKYHLNKEKYSRLAVISRNKKYSINCAKSALRSHSSKGHICEITVEELTNLYDSTIYCPICKVKLTKEYGHGLLQTAPSLDRKNNESILTIHNVWVICANCNATKRDRSMKEFVKYCSEVFTNFKEMI
jgi:hypothetical protein